MRRIIVSVVVLFLAVTCSTAWAIPMATVGGLDTFLLGTNLGNSGDDTVLSWAEATVGFDLSYDSMEGKIEGNSGWIMVDDHSGVYALTLTGDPAYFLVKTGNNETSSYRHFLFENVAGLAWAVVDLNALGITNIGKVSHTSQYDQYDGGNTPVPEPSTILLLGSGLLGLGWYGRKRKKA